MSLIRFVTRLLVGLAVLGGSLILLFFVLNQVKAHGGPLAPLAAKAEGWMQP